MTLSNAVAWILPWLIALVCACGSANAASPATKKSAAAIAPTLTAEELFEWVEATFASYFPGHQATHEAGTFVYRYYPASGNYIAVSGTAVYVMGTVIGSNAVPKKVGELADFACPAHPERCGLKVVHQVMVGSDLREFIVYVPWKSIGGSQSPAVIIYHGTSGDGEKFFSISGWREKADVEGLIAVFPSALTHCFFEDDNKNGMFEASERKVVTKWAAGKLGDPLKRPLCTEADKNLAPALDLRERNKVNHGLADDLAFVDAVLAVLQTDYKADMRRVYASGFSNGAEMTGRLAADRSLQFAAVHCASSVVSETDTPAARPISVVWSVGANDDEQAPGLGFPIPPGIPLTEDLASPLADPAVNRFRPAVLLPFSKVLQITEPYSRWSQVRLGKNPGALTSHFEYTVSTIGATNSFRAVIVEGATHQYPNGENHPIRMADVMWEFFKTQTLP